MTNSIFVYIADMPTSVHEIVVPCNLGFTVYINGKLSCLGQQKAYQHALSHIENDDFEKDDVQLIEFNAHELEKHT